MAKELPKMLKDLEEQYKSDIPPEVAAYMSRVNSRIASLAELLGDENKVEPPPEEKQVVVDGKNITVNYSPKCKDTYFFMDDKKIGTIIGLYETDIGKIKSRAREFLEFKKNR